MTDDIPLAFAHPSERSIAMANPDIRDRISLTDHIRDVDIGAFQVERGKTQKVRFDVVVEVGLPDLDEAVSNDDVDKILSYDAITEAIDRGLAAERLNLLETLAARIAEDILVSPLAARVFVRIQKLDRGPGALGVEIVRERDTRDPIAPVNTSKPCVVYLADDVVQSDALGAVLDRLETFAMPLVLCVGPMQVPTAGNHVMVQRRIDLLSIEQNAWQLAGRDSRCVVVATRTELDWAMKNGQICVWAPSKLILDAQDAEVSDKIDPIEMMDWFAKKFVAGKTLIIGKIDDTPEQLTTIDNFMLNDFLGSE